MKQQKERMKRTLALSFLVGACCLPGYAGSSAPSLLAGSYPVEEVLQNKKITGVVKDNFGPVIGANVSVKGTNIGAITDMDGKFSFEAPDDGILVVSFVGYTTQEIPLQGRTDFNITLKEDNELLDEVVVTALGIKREKKALGYAMQEVKTDDLTENRSTSVSNMLQGKIAGVQISQSSGGVGGPTRIVMRGMNSLSGNNAPLWVVDGLPILDNTNASANSQFFYSSGAADLNPDDIESISVLKGANAAALYGSRAQSGAIVITTKKGKEGKLQLEYNGYVAMTQAYDSYEFQNVYGQGSQGVFSLEALGSWGPKMEGQMIPNWRRELYGDESYSDYAMLPQTNQLDDFFRTGLAYTNSLSASGGTENISARLSFTDTRNKGIVPNESLVKQNYNLNVELKNKYVVLGAKIAYFREKVKNRPQTYNGLWQHFIQMPRSIRLQDLQNPIGLDGYAVNWSGPSNIRFNPYALIMNENGNALDRDRFQGQITLTGNITDYLKVTGRIGIDRINDNVEQYHAYLHQGESPDNMLYIDNTVNSELNADLMVNFDKRFNDFSVTANVGIATQYSKYKALGAESGEAILPHFIAISNGMTKLATQDFWSKRINSVLGNATVGYKSMVYLDLTARNDWSSTLPSTNWSYFYPSASVSAIVSEMFKLPDWITYFKVRGSVAQVGNDTTPYELANVYTLSSIGDYTYGQTSNTYPLADLKPESTLSWEVGFDYRMFNNRLGVDFTFYKSTTTDQILSMPVPASSGYTQKMVNAGKMESKGIELMVTATPIQTKDWKWDVTLNWGKNETRNVYLDEKIKRYQFPLTTMVRIGSVVMDEGGKFGDIVSTSYRRNADGRILVDDNGLPLIDTSSTKVIGNMMPKWTGSFGTTVAWKDLVFSALIDVRYGGQFLSLTDALACGAGTSARTLEGRDGMVVNGIVESTGLENTKKITAEQYYSTIAGNYPVGEEFLHDATYVKMRELSIGYTLPKKWLSKTPLRSVKVSIVGRDLFNIYKAAPVNAEFALNSQDVFQAFELAALPSTRNIGFSLNVKF